MTYYFFTSNSFKIIEEMNFIFVYKFVLLYDLYEIHLQHFTPIYFLNMMKHYNSSQTHQSW